MALFLTIYILRNEQRKQKEKIQAPVLHWTQFKKLVCACEVEIKFTITMILPLRPLDSGGTRWEEGSGACSVIRSKWCDLCLTGDSMF